MIIIELIGSISFIIAFVGAVTFTIIYIKSKQHVIQNIHDHRLNRIEQSDTFKKSLYHETNQSASTLPFQDFKFNASKKLSIINVIHNDEICKSPIKYGIQWKSSSNEDMQPKTIDSSLNKITISEFDQGDSLTFHNQIIDERYLKEKVQKNSLRNLDQTNNINQRKISHRSSISTLDITIPSHISSSIDLEQFECISTTSNLSEFLNTY